ncbi:acyl-CoA carboxylase subunit beta, partial [Chloroflexota bacterium]
DEALKSGIEKLRRKREAALLGGGKWRIRKQHASGRLTARERIERLLDTGSFVETNMLAGLPEDSKHNLFGDGVVIGYGKIDERRVGIFSQDFTVNAGSTGPIHRGKMTNIIDKAMKIGIPIIGLWDSTGGRLDQSNPSMPCARSSFFRRFTEASGVIPQISAILGPAAGNAGYGAALTDFIFMADGISHTFATGPLAVKKAMGENIDMEALGGARVHCQLSGLADLRVRTEDECFAKIRTLLSYLPANNNEYPPRVLTEDDQQEMVNQLNELVPSDGSRVYDMSRIIHHILDNGDFFELKPEFARNLIIGFGRLNGYSVGIVANQPLHMGGALTIDASDKEARFIRFCDAFNIPLVFFVDTPGYLPGSLQEHGGILRHGAKVLYAVAESVVPKIAVLIRKAYGGAKPAMGIDKDMGVDHIYAWPIAESAVMGAEASVRVIFRKEIAQAQNPEKFIRRKVSEFKETADAYSMVYGELVDDVIEPQDTRARLIATLENLQGKKESKPAKKHGNMPL